MRSSQVIKCQDNELCDQLEAVVGKGNVSQDPVVLASYAFDSSPVPPAFPDFVVLPHNHEQVQEIIKIANGLKIPIIPISGGVNVGGVCSPTQGGIILDLRWMDKILEINTDAGYAVIEPGVTFDQLTASLRQVGFRCHVPTAPGGATPLGNYLSKPSGSLSNRHLDSILGLEVVLPKGELVRTGSSAFPTSGWHMRYGPYPDLTGLFLCAYGTLGVITKAAINIYPLSEDQRMPLVSFKKFPSSVAFVKDIVRTGLAEHCIIWNWHFYRTYDIVYNANELPQVPPELFMDPREAPDNLPYNIVTSNMSGYSADLDGHEKLVQEVAEKHGGETLTLEKCKESFPGISRSWSQFYLEHRQPKMEHNKKYGLGRYLPWIVQGEPEIISKLEKEALGQVAEMGIKPICYYSQPFDYGRAFFFRMFSFVDSGDQKLIEAISTKYKSMYDWALQKYGATPFRHRRDPFVLPRLGGYYELLKALKKEIDPNNIMNPGVALF